jgi:molybdopterin synthase sulfur carrier subunit
MAEIKITYWGHLADLAGRKEDAVTGAETVRDVLTHVKAAYGKDAEKAAKTMLITVNGKSILRTGLYKTKVEAGDGVSFLPICAGG